MKPSVTIMSIADIELFQTGIGAKAAWPSSSSARDRRTGVDMEFSWNSYEKGYGTPRHKHTFDQFRFALEGDREIKDGYLKPGDFGSIRGCLVRTPIANGAEHRPWFAVSRRRRHSVFTA